MSTRKPRLEPIECDKCFGCGHTCGECKLPINVCICDLDTEAIEPCGDCGSTGILPADPPEAPTDA
jgi:hypothetical protein